MMSTNYPNRTRPEHARELPRSDDPSNTVLILGKPIPIMVIVSMLVIPLAASGVGVLYGTSFATGLAPAAVLDGLVGGFLSGLGAAKVAGTPLWLVALAVGSVIAERVAR